MEVAALGFRLLIVVVGGRLLLLPGLLLLVVGAWRLPAVEGREEFLIEEVDWGVERDGSCCCCCAVRVLSLEVVGVRS